VIESSRFLLSIRGVRVTTNQVVLLVVYPSVIQAIQAREVLVWDQEAIQAREVLLWDQEAIQAREVLLWDQEARQVLVSGSRSDPSPSGAGFRVKKDTASFKDELISCANGASYSTSIICGQFSSVYNRATAKSLTREIGVPFAALARVQRVTHVGRDVLRPPKRGSIHAYLQIHLDFAVALAFTTKWPHPDIRVRQRYVLFNFELQARRSKRCRHGGFCGVFGN
jgi:hypothetical protein